MKCKRCGHSAGLFNLNRGICKSCQSNHPKLLENLPFKSNEAAFEYATKYLARPITKESIVFGLVVGKASPNKWKVKIATDQGLFEVANCCSISESLQLKMGVEINNIEIGDLVAVELSSYTPKLSIENENQIYLILMKLKPILSIEQNIFLPDLPD